MKNSSHVTNRIDTVHYLYVANALDELSNNGWELVSVVKNGDERELYLKKYNQLNPWKFGPP